MNRDEAVGFLGKHGWLASLPPSFRRHIVANSIFSTVKRGEKLYGQGERGAGMLGLASGQAMACVNTSQTDERVVYVANPSFWGGEGTAIKPGGRKITLRAITPSAFLRVTKPALLDHLEKHPPHWRYIAANLLANFDRAMLVVARMATDSTEKRIAQVILHSVTEEGVPLADDLVLHVNQKELGLLANVSLNTVNTALKKLEESGCIKIGYRTIGVLDFAGLARFANPAACLGNEGRAISALRRMPNW